MTATPLEEVNEERVEGLVEDFCKKFAQLEQDFLVQDEGSSCDGFRGGEIPEVAEEEMMPTERQIQGTTLSKGWLPEEKDDKEI